MQKTLIDYSILYKNAGIVLHCIKHNLKQPYDNISELCNDYRNLERSTILMKPTIFIDQFF